MTTDNLKNIKPKVYSLKSGLDYHLINTFTKFDTVWINTFALIICELLHISRKTAIQVFLCLFLTIDSLENIKSKVYLLKLEVDILF